MVYIHNLFEEVPVLENMIKAILSIKMVAEFKNEDGQYLPVSENTRIATILNEDNEFAVNILGQALRRYLIYGHVCIYKTKSRRAALAQSENPDMTEFNYKDGMVAGLYIIQDEEAYMDNNGIYHIDDDYMISIRKKLNRGEFIYISDWSPTKISHSTSIGRRVDLILQKRITDQTISEVLGIDNDLIIDADNGSAISQERREILIKRAFEDTIIPLAHQFKTAIERDIGLAPEMRIVLDAGDMEQWVNIWDNVNVLQTGEVE